MRRRAPAALLALPVLAGAVLALAATAPAAGAASTDSVPVKPTGSVTVTYRGNGHGHGMSQYGAYGAALAGLSTAQILAHYYPGTALASMPAGSPMLRVKISGTGSTLVVSATGGLTVTGVTGTLPTSGISRYRLVADARSGLTLQRLSAARGASYTTVRSGLPDGARFVRPNHQPVLLLFTDGSSTWYYGGLRAVRLAETGSSAGVATVNIVSYNDYAAGVAPREMPASWSAAATAAQAVAARTYAIYEQQHSAGRYYDLCDTSMCQVYGGHFHTDADGDTWTDLPQAASSTSNEVLTYKGSPIFAQYSASNGGWSTSGGQPYLRAAADKYDPGRSGDPYVNATEKVSVRSIASYYGLATVTKITITKRDGNGTWGGRVVSATVTGTTSAKKATTVTTDGDDLQWALGLGTTWFRLAAS